MLEMSMYMPQKRNLKVTERRSAKHLDERRIACSPSNIDLSAWRGAFANYRVRRSRVADDMSYVF